MKNLIPTELHAVLVELFKTHHSAREASDITSLPYNSVVSVFNGFKVARIPKYNRITLSPVLAKELQEHVN
jgi:hypothetical protein